MHFGQNQSSQQCATLSHFEVTYVAYLFSCYVTEAMKLTNKLTPESSSASRKKIKIHTKVHAKRGVLQTSNTLKLIKLIRFFFRIRGLKPFYA